MTETVLHQGVRAHLDRCLAETASATGGRQAARSSSSQAEGAVEFPKREQANIGSDVRPAGRPSQRGQARPSRAANPCLPLPAGQKTLAFEAARAVSRLGD